MLTDRKYLMANAQVKKKKINGETVTIIVILAIIIALFAFFLKDVMIPLFKLQLDNDLEGASALLKSKGIVGGISVILIEALQMIIIFVSAEFIQIASGLSYPLYISLPLCDIGICLGATVIFLLVRVFKFNSSTYEKNRGMIDKIASNAKDRNIVILLYLLFFMPFIPFGAICYYGASTKISYGKYMLTVSTSAIPSVVVSVLIGQAGKLFFTNSIPLWLLVLIVIALSVLLFALIYWFMHRFVLKGTDRTPDSLFFDIFFMVVKLLQFGKRKPVVEDDLMCKVDLPYLVLSNHESFMDFFYLYYLTNLKSPSYVYNSYYCVSPFFKLIQKHCGFIPKKLLADDKEAKSAISTMIGKGFPVVIFPEDRLSPDGRSNSIVMKDAAFYKKLDVDIVLVKIDGGYYARPKWRRRTYSSDVKVTVERVLKRQEISSMSADELEKVIKETLYNDASHINNVTYRQKDKAKGLEKVLYRCADCGALYKTAGKGNELVCRSCGAVHKLDEKYHFTDPAGSIPGYYDAIRKMEEKEIGDLVLFTGVKTKVYGKNMKTVKREDGKCTLDKNRFRYTSESEEFSIPVKDIPALGFTAGKRIELYHDNKLYYFHPVEEPVQAARWSLVMDILKSNTGNKTQD